MPAQLLGWAPNPDVPYMNMFDTAMGRWSQSLRGKREQEQRIFEQLMKVLTDPRAPSAAKQQVVEGIRSNPTTSNMFSERGVTGEALESYATEPSGMTLFEKARVDLYGKSADLSREMFEEKSEATRVAAQKREKLGLDEIEAEAARALIEQRQASAAESRAREQAIRTPVPKTDQLGELSAGADRMINAYVTSKFPAHLMDEKNYPGWSEKWNTLRPEEGEPLYAKFHEIRQQVAMVRQRADAERKRIMALYLQNPEAFRAEITQRLDEVVPGSPEEEKILDALAEDLLANELYLEETPPVELLEEALEGLPRLRRDIPSQQRYLQKIKETKRGAQKRREEAKHEEIVGQALKQKAFLDLEQYERIPSGMGSKQRWWE